MFQQSQMNAEEGMEDAVLQGKVAWVVYKMAIKDIPGRTSLELGTRITPKYCINALTNRYCLKLFSGCVTNPLSLPVDRKSKV